MAGAQSQAMLEKMELRQSYRNIWHTDLTNAVAADLPWCCMSLWCGPCVSYMLRRRALYNDMSRCMLTLVRVLRWVHAVQRQVRREPVSGSMPCNRGVLLLRQFGCFHPVPAAGRVQHPDDAVRQLHHRLHVLPAAARLHLLPSRLHRRQQRALGGRARHLLHVQLGLLDGLLVHADAAQGGDGQEGRHVEHHVCASDAGDVALVKRTCERVRLCDRLLRAEPPVPSQAQIWKVAAGSYQPSSTTHFSDLMFDTMASL